MTDNYLVSEAPMDLIVQRFFEVFRYSPVSLQRPQADDAGFFSHLSLGNKPLSDTPLPGRVGPARFSAPCSGRLETAQQTSDSAPSRPFFYDVDDIGGII